MFALRWPEGISRKGGCGGGEAFVAGVAAAAGGFYC
jgi:hypothetical protein